MRFTMTVPFNLSRPRHVSTNDHSGTLRVLSRSWLKADTFLKQAYLQLAVNQGISVARWILWKHHFSPLDLSNLLSWFNIPAYLVPPSQPAIQRLPPEILSRIFSFTVHSNCFEPGEEYSRSKLGSAVTSGKNSPTTPLILGHICRAWRSLVHDSPLLWSTINVRAPREKDVKLVNFWLQRTATCPLILRLEQAEGHDLPSIKIANMFWMESWRWKRISVELSITGELFLISLQPGDTPIVEELRISLSPGTLNHPANRNLLPIFLASPALTTLSWGRFISMDSISQTASSWTRLRNISLCGIIVDARFLDALSQCHSLRTLHLQLVKLAMGSSNVQPVTIPSLERFSCETCPASIFNFFTLPALTDLRVMDLDELLPSLESMVQRSGCKLKTLGLYRLALCVLTSPIFHNVSALYVKTILRHPWNDRLAMGFMAHPAVLPSIRHLHVDHNASCDGLMAGVAESRVEILQSLHVGCAIESLPKDAMAFEHLRKAGITVVVHRPRRDSAHEPDNDSPTGNAARSVFSSDIDRVWA